MKSKKFKGFFEEVKRFGIDIDYLKNFIYDYLDAYVNREYNNNQHEDLFQQALANGLNVQPYISLIKGWEIQYDKKCEEYGDVGLTPLLLTEYPMYLAVRITYFELKWNAYDEIDKKVINEVYGFTFDEAFLDLLKKHIRDNPDIDVDKE